MSGPVYNNFCLYEIYDLLFVVFSCMTLFVTGGNRDILLTLKFPNNCWYGDNFGLI